MIVTNTPAIEAALPHLAPDGLLVIFGGLARGTLAALDLSNVYLGGAQITGSAGSTIHDQAPCCGRSPRGTSPQPTLWPRSAGWTPRATACKG